jgi:glycosyltransferase involved in cell wall biosynthesis
MNRRLLAVAPYSADAVFTRSDLGAAAAHSVGHCPWSEKAPGLMRILDVLVLPSYEEPFGTVLAEAMAVGTPVVATRVDGLPEDGVERVEGLIAA